MSGVRILFLAAPTFFAWLVQAQSVAGKQDLTVQVSPAQAWTDTGLDLQAGDVAEISATATSAHPSAASPACDPAGLSGATANPGSLPLPSAPAGALIARLHGEGSAPVLVGAESQLKIEGASHLFLRMNLSEAATCQGDFAVKVRRISKESAATSSDGGQQKTRGQQLKSQLGTAAEVFMAGQFGIGKSESGGSNATSSGGSSGTDTATSTTALKISENPLDADLRKSLDGLPRRVNDQFNNLGDMVNFVIVGSQKDVQAALEAATWHVADTDNRKAVLSAALETYGNKDYLAMPMSTLFLFGRKQDFGYEMAEPIAMVASRHHFRIWKAPFTWSGHEIWVGAGTHDIGFAKDRRKQ